MSEPTVTGRTWAAAPAERSGGGRVRTVVTAVGLALPGAAAPQDLLAPCATDAPPVDPAALIGKKGLRYLDQATRLALCSADDVLRRSGLVANGGPVPAVGAGRPSAAELTVDGAGIAVVVSSNLGNLDTVEDVVATIARDGSTRLTSPIVTPRLSSNVVASEIAIRFGLRGPNLMLCNGGTSGLDAVHWAAVLLAGGRARYVLVVGVEPDTGVARRLTGRDRVVDGAVALLIERTDTAEARGAEALATLGGYVRTGGPAETLAALLKDGPERARAWFVPDGDRTAADLLPGVARHDAAAGRGETSGAHGVLQCAAAVGYFATGGRGPVYAVAGTEDATAGLVLHGPEQR